MSMKHKIFFFALSVDTARDALTEIMHRCLYVSLFKGRITPLPDESNQYFQIKGKPSALNVPRLLTRLNVA